MKIDWWLVVPMILLLLLGLLVLRSVAPHEVAYQLLFIGVSTLAFLFFSYMDHRVPFTLHMPLYVASLILLVSPYLFGTHSRGALRWLQFGQFTLQPSEIVKPFLLITFSMIIMSKLTKKLPILIGLFLLPWAVIFFQPDLGTSLVIAVGWATIILSRSSIKSILATTAVVGLVSIPIFFFFLKPYQYSRLITYVDPYRDPLGRGYHIIQSLITVGSGLFWGRGLGQGPQSQLRFLPEHHTDFIFASLAEELGFVGASCAIVLFTLLLWRVYKISQSVPDLTSALFCLGSLTMLGFQTFVNIGMNLGLVPITGVTLPFLSYGGSSLLSLGILFGLIHSISLRSRDKL